jgi:hypothetical protein
MEFTQIIYNNSVPTSHKTHCVSITEANKLKLFRETITTYSENNTRHTNTLCRENSGSLKSEHVIHTTYSNHCALTCNTILQVSILREFPVNYTIIE